MTPTEASFSGELFTALAQLTKVLNDLKTDYALIGGLGAALRGTIRTTRDIDLLLAVPQLEFPPLLEALQARGFFLDTVDCIRQWSEDNLLDIQFGQIRIDWLKASIPVFQTILNRAEWEEIDGCRIRVADAEGLILLKLISFRPRDEEDIQGILASNPGSLDLAWIRQEWTKLAELDLLRADHFENMVADYYQP